jgi:hypothetical protein
MSSSDPTREPPQAGRAGVVLLAGVALRLATFSAPTSPTTLPTPRAARSARSASESKRSATASGPAASLAPNGTFTTL